MFHFPFTILTYISAIVVRGFSNYRKYKCQNYFIVPLFFICPLVAHAQYTDNDRFNISFKWYANQQGKLEYIEDNMVYQFIPTSETWKVTVRNTSTEEAWINWRNAEFIVNGRASGVSFYPATMNRTTEEIIYGNSEICQTITAANLITQKKANKIYKKSNIKKGERAAVTIVLPIKVGKRPQFFHTFDFVIVEVN